MTMDVREYAAIKGITTEEAARELGEQYDNEPAPETHVPWLSNSGQPVQSEIAGGDNLSQAARDKLRQTVARIEKLEEEKREIANQIRDVYAEAKSMGYDTKALRSAVRLRKLDRQEREEQEAILDTYMLVLGEIDS